MSNYRNQVKQFTGKVTIGDVQREFDRIIGVYNQETQKWEGGINGLVDKVNTINSVQNFDFSKGYTGLSASSYTLTLKALKTVIDIYKDTWIEKPQMVKLSENGNKYKLFPGLWANNTKGIIQTEDALVTMADQNGTRYYYSVDGVVNQPYIDIYPLKDGSEYSQNAIVNIGLMANTVALPSTIPTLSLQTRTFSQWANGGEYIDNSSNSCFALVRVGTHSDWSGEVVMNGLQLAYTNGAGNHRGKRNSWGWNPFWVPRGPSLSWYGNHCGQLRMGYTIQ